MWYWCSRNALENPVHYLTDYYFEVLMANIPATLHTVGSIKTQLFKNLLLRRRMILLLLSDIHVLVIYYIGKLQDKTLIKHNLDS